MTSSPKSADKHLPSEIKLLSLPCMNRLNDGNDIHFRDKATATREAPRLYATAPSYDGTYVVGSNFPVDKGSGQFGIMPFKPHRRSCMHSSRLRLSGQPWSIFFETGVGDELIRKNYVDSLKVPHSYLKSRA